MGQPCFVSTRGSTVLLVTKCHFKTILLSASTKEAAICFAVVFGVREKYTA
jgi:hypothetical protein